MKIFNNSSFCCPVEIWSQKFIFIFYDSGRKGSGLVYIPKALGLMKQTLALWKLPSNDPFSGATSGQVVASCQMDDPNSGASSCAGIETFNQSLLGRAFWINWYSQDYLLLLPKWMVWMYLFFSCLDLFLGGASLPPPWFKLNRPGTKTFVPEALRKTTHLAIILLIWVRYGPVNKIINLPSLVWWCCSPHQSPPHAPLRELEPGWAVLRAVG